MSPGATTAPAAPHGGTTAPGPPGGHQGAGPGDGGPGHGSPPDGTARRSAVVAAATLFSRATGLVRVVAVGAVLGPTFFANCFQAGSTVPNLVFTSVAGPLLAMVVVPALVRAEERGGPDGGRALLAAAGSRLVGLGWLASLALLAASPLIGALLTVGVDGPAAGRARAVATLIVAISAPQVALYMLISLAVAAQQARGRFALAALAPAAENLVLVTAVVLTSRHFESGHAGSDYEVGTVPLAYAAGLAVAGTAAVAVHAAVQLAAAGRAGLGIPWRPRLRRHPEADALRRSLSGGSVWVAAGPAASIFVLLGVAGTVPGGVFPVQVAITVYSAAVYVGGGAVSIAALPALTRSAERGDRDAFAAGWRDCVRYALVAAAPLALLLAVLRTPVAEVLSAGSLRHGGLVPALAGCLVLVAFAQVAGGLHDVGRRALFALGDSRSPGRSSLAALALSVFIGVAALAVPAGGPRLVTLAGAVAAAECAGAAVAVARVHHALRPRRPFAVADTVPVLLALAAMAPCLAAAAWYAAGVGAPGPADLVVISGLTAASLAGYAAALGRFLRGHRLRDGAGAGADIAGPAVACLGIAVGAGLLAGSVGVPGMLAAAGLAVALAATVAAARRPDLAVYAYLGSVPLVAGIGRGTLLPLVRPNEALLALLCLGAGAGAAWRWAGGERPRVRLTGLDAAVAAFVALSTAWPAAWLMFRGRTPSGAELAALLPVCKLAGLYLLVRLALGRGLDLGRCTRLVVWPAALVAVIAILQTLHVGPVIALLETLWSPEDAGGELGARGTSTLSSPIATGDYLVMSGVLLLCCAARGLLGRRERLGLGLVLGAGVLAAGQFSTWIAAAMAGVLVLRRFPVLRARSARLLPLLAVACLVGAPAFVVRVGALAGQGLPVSWLGRWDNLTHFYLPAFEPATALFGVTPDTVLPAPETWRDVIYLEAGYLDLLWIGGVPLLAGFAWLSVAVLRRAAARAAAPGFEGAAAETLGVCWWMILVLTVLDPHLTQRGTGDLLFTLMAVAGGSLYAART